MSNCPHQQEELKQYVCQYHHTTTHHHMHTNAPTNYHGVSQALLGLQSHYLHTRTHSTRTSGSHRCTPPISLVPRASLIFYDHVVQDYNNGHDARKWCPFSMSYHYWKVEIP